MKTKVIAVIAGVIICGVLFVVSGGTDPGISETYESDDIITEIESETSNDNAEPEAVFVYVCGRVKKPDVYELQSGARVYDAIKAAGGFEKDACREYLNLAALVKDEDRIYVPSEKEIVSGEIRIQDESGGKININTATAEELKTLNGIGDSRANDIIKYRETNGKFKTIEEIMLVPGIKDAAFSKISESITV